MKTLIGEGGARIIQDAFEMSINRRKLHKEGYRLYLWNEWRSMWRMFQVVDGDEYEDMNGYVGTREEFETYVLDYHQHSI